MGGEQKETDINTSVILAAHRTLLSAAALSLDNPGGNKRCGSANLLHELHRNFYSSAVGGHIILFLFVFLFLTVLLAFMQREPQFIIPESKLHGV